MKLWLILLVTLFTSCSYSSTCENPDFITSGLQICSEGFTSPEDIDTAVRVTEEIVQEIYPEVINIVETFDREEVNISFIDEDLSVRCEEIKRDVYRCDNNIGGVTLNSKHIYIRYDPCLSSTSFHHELLHVIEYYYLGGSQEEKDHSTPYFFKQDAVNQGKDYRAMIEWKITEELQSIFQCHLDK